MLSAIDLIRRLMLLVSVVLCVSRLHMVMTQLSRCKPDDVRHALKLTDAVFLCYLFLFNSVTLLSVLLF